MMPGLRRANAVVGVIYLAQAAAIAALSNGFAIPVLVAFQDGPPGTPLPAEQRVFSVSYRAGVQRMPIKLEKAASSSCLRRS